MGELIDEKYVLFDQTVHQTWGDGFIVVGRAATTEDGEKIVAAMNSHLSRVKFSIGDDLDTILEARNEIIRRLKNLRKRIR